MYLSMLNAIPSDPECGPLLTKQSFPWLLEVNTTFFTFSPRHYCMFVAPATAPMTTVGDPTDPEGTKRPKEDPILACAHIFKCEALAQVVWQPIGMVL